MNVTKVLTNAYEEKTLGEHGKNEPKRTQTNPIKANFRKGRNERKYFYNKELRTINYEQ